MLEFNWLIHNVPVVDSTQTYAKQLLLAGGIDNRQLVVITDEQTDGHGQYGRKWASLEGNIHMSLVFPVQEPVSTLTYIACLATGEVILARNENLPVQYKWVNDVLIDGKKVAGVLTEHIHHTVIIGIGLNLVAHPDIDQPTTDLEAEGVSMTKHEFIEEFLNVFVKIYNIFLDYGFDKFRGTWKSRAYMLGKDISIKSGEEVISGRFQDIDEDGSLIIQHGGQVARIKNGMWLKE